MMSREDKKAYMNILILGANGYLGSKVTHALVKKLSHSMYQKAQL